jgi:SAM-dependent methyltransferase
MMRIRTDPGASMTATAAPPQVSPALFFETMNAYQRTAALKGAIELDLFTAIGEGHRTATDIARKLGASERGTRILCDYLVVIGFLTKQRDRYDLTPDSKAFLDRRSPMYVGSAVGFLGSPLVTTGFRDVAAIVRKGGTVLEEGGHLGPEAEVWMEFARAMAPLARFPAERLAQLLGAGPAGPWKVLDVAAGHGAYGIAVARHNPGAEVYALDWPNVLAVASENARAAGIAERHHLLPGSALEVEFGTAYDLVLLTNFLHHFDPPTIDRLLRKVHAALKPGGRAVAVEFVPDENRVSPPIAAAFGLVMLAGTPGGDAYTFAEYERMFRGAGFADTQLHELPPTFSRVIVARR